MLAARFRDLYPIAEDPPEKEKSPRTYSEVRKHIRKRKRRVPRVSQPTKKVAKRKDNSRYGS